MKKRHRKGRRRRKGNKLAKRETKVEKYLGISKNYRDVVRMVPLTLAITSTPWPRKMRTQLKVSTSTAVANAVGAQYFSWFLNCFGDGTAATNGCGPQINFAGVFAKTYPAGLKGILQTAAAGGTAICPYNLYRIRRAKMYVDISPQPITPATTPSGEIRIVLLPSVQPSFLGTAFTAVEEQPYANFKAIPNPIFGTSATTAASGGGSLAGAARTRMVSFGSVGRLFGVPPSAVDNNDDYRGVVNGLVPNLAYFHLGLLGDGTGTFSANIEANIVYDVEFYGLNNLASAQNN